jgi:glycosyltransferase involved in cell wall biosynthesis
MLTTQVQFPSVQPNQRLALLAATSGHSGVDHLWRQLIQQCADWHIPVDVLQIRGHGPYLGSVDHHWVRIIDLPSKHVYTAIPFLIRYLRQQRPSALLCDKDRVNRSVIFARMMARVKTRIVVRLGTTVSVNLAARSRVERWLQYYSMRYWYPYADAVLVPTDSVADDLIRFAALPRQHIHVVASPIIDSQRIIAARQMAPVHPWFEPDQPPVIIGVGELSARKDFATLIRAFALVYRRCSCRLMILGRGRRYSALLTLAKQLGVASAVTLLGFQADPYPFMCQARVFALSSQWEGLPVALIEALALHTPVAATACPGGTADLLHNHACGLLTAVGDSYALANALMHWLQVPKPDASVFEHCIAPYHRAPATAAYLRVLKVID